MQPQVAPARITSSSVACFSAQIGQAVLIDNNCICNQMIKLVQVLVLAAVFAAAVSATGDQFQVDDDSDSDLQVLDSLTDDLDDDASASALAVDPCPDRTMSCNAGFYLQTTGTSKCTCAKCPNGMTSRYNPTKPFANVDVASCYACPLPYRIFRCPPLVQGVCGDLELCIRPGNQAYWTKLFQTFGWPANGVGAIPWLFPQYYNTPFFSVRTLEIGELSENDAQVGAKATDGLCAIDSVGCCLPGTFGKDGGLCTTCPLTASGARQSSSYSTPSATCTCPNIDTLSCKPCNICEQLNGMNQCESRCSVGSAKRCSTTAIPATTKAAAIKAGVCYV